MEEYRLIFKVKKYTLRAAAILSAVFALCVFGAWSGSGRSGLVSGKERENRLYPSEAEALETAGLLPVTCTPVDERYLKEGGGFSEELLTGLQECVREGGIAAAIEAYRDDTLLIDADTLLSLCPNYENLIAELAKKRDTRLLEEKIPDGIAAVYRLDLDGDVLLVEYKNAALPWVILKKTEDTYLAGIVRLSIFTVGNIDDWRRCGTTVFADGDGYCLLEWGQSDVVEVETLGLYRFTAEDDWVENVGETGLYFEREILYIKERAVRAEPVFFYRNGRHSLTGEVQAYVEENTYMFAGRLEEKDMIWGDEMPAEPVEGANYSWQLYTSQADYDNDGVMELFYRDTDGEARNKLRTAEGDGYRDEAISLYGGDMPAVRLWFVEFSGKTVTFEIVEPYGAAYPLLAAYLVEGDRKTPLLTCQLVYGKTVEIDGHEYANYVHRNSFQLRRTAPLAADLEQEIRKQTAFGKKLTAWIREAGRDVTIEPLRAETPFSEEFLEFIREGAAWCFSGRLFSAYAAPYEVYSEEELEKIEEEFEEKYDTYLPGGLIYYRDAPDGTRHYLVRNRECSDYGVNTLCWYWYNGEKFEEEPITDLSHDYGSYCGVLSYGGQLYCVITDIDLYGAMWRMDLLPLRDDGGWEHYCISFYYEEKTYEIHSFSEKEALNDYVEKEAEAIYAAVSEDLYWWGASYSGCGEWGEIPQEVWRDIKNRDFSYSQYRYRESFNSSYNEYVPVDVDNDGELEYVSVWLGTGKRRAAGVDYTIYGWRDGIFTELFMGHEDIYYAWELFRYADEDGGYGIVGELDQMWFEEMDGVTYLFTAEKLTLLDGYLVRARVIQDGKVRDAGAWLFRHNGVILQDIQEMGEYDSWLSA